MYHSITFGDCKTVTRDGIKRTVFSGKNTWNDWNLIPEFRPSVVPPPPNKKQVAIPGTDGAIDLSSNLTGYMTYGNRAGSWDFIVVNKNIDVYPTKPSKHPYDWTTVYSSIMRELHGRPFKCMLEDDPAFYYEGLFSVNGWKSDKEYSRITIDYDLGPYKYSVQGSNEPWLWDPFSFENGVIRSIGVWNNGTWSNEIAVNGTTSHMFVAGSISPVTFSIKVEDISGTIVFHVNNAYQQTISSNGTKTFKGIRLDRDSNEIWFSGHGTVIINYRIGEF